ncbi:hypothetical protein [Cryobacterium tagatosivorans]|uniref:Uncharacterized protein n=1 Tax=Cryobacterium tagatosivorans TaxID=1259199 RepID=A0A4R8UKP8_9MICO|nr:hypothetical protein [Cryobacterium tagatosivorans]TFB56336.1 hypothetical protein E3O23_00945 [Cryobacterium tagatosivorans]
MALAGPGELLTALDVLENALGSRPTPEQLRKLTIPELDELSGLLGELSEAQCDDEIPGGASLIGGWLGGYWSEPSLRGDLGKSLLYYSNLLVLDPLADYFDDRSRLPATRPIRVRRKEDKQFNTLTSGPDMWSRNGSFGSLRDAPEEAVGRFAAIVGNLYSLEPLIRSGVVVLRSQWPILSRNSEALAASVRHDIRSKEMQSLAREPSTAGDSFAVWDNLRGGAVSFPSGVLSSDEPWETQHVFYDLAKTLAIADAAGAQHVPSTERDLELLRTKVSSAARSTYPRAFLGEVARVAVPSFDIPIQQAVAMRESSASFEDWLDLIRRAGAADDAGQLRERVQDELRPAIRSVEAEIGKSTMLSLLDKTLADVIFTGGVASIAALASGGSPIASAGAAAASGIVSWIRRAYGQRSLGGAEAVLAALVRGKEKS